MKAEQTKSSRDIGIIQKKDKNGVTSWYARIVRTEPSGNKRQHTQKAENKSHARQLRDELSNKYKTGGKTAIDGAKLTFRELAEDYKSRKLIPAKYHQDRKVSGLRSHKPVLSALDQLLSHFGNKRIKDITPAEIERFKQKRLDTPVTRHRGDKRVEVPRAIASVNRELALLRTMFNDAIHNGWATRSPFINSRLISLSDEVKRERVLSFDEEVRLLAACVENITVEYERNGVAITAHQKSKRQHLRPLLIAALDTAMRSGELLTLRWRDIDFENRIIRVLAFNTKTARPRNVGITNRVLGELAILWTQSPQDQEELVFGIKDTVKRAFGSACRDAKIADFRFHDCRHTAITRMIQAGLSPMEVMKISGHSQMNTFARYVNPDSHAVNRIADVLTAFNAESNRKLVQDVSAQLN